MVEYFDCHGSCTTPSTQLSGNEISTRHAEPLVLLEKPEKGRLHQLPTGTPRREIYRISAKVALVLIFAISYHIFCFTVHYRKVPIGRSGVLSLSFLHFSTVSVITTVAILIVYVALWPVNSVIDEIRAEEFFRLMHIHPNGVPLDSVNAVSATTTGLFDIFMATIHRHCSPLLTSTLVISLLITATSSIAPAALSTGSVWIDVDNSNFLIGALPAFEDVPMGYDYYKLMPMASTMAWVENFFNFTNGYYRVTSSEGDQFEYLVPFPPGYTSTMKAYWTTDVIVFDPSCSWQTATTRPVNSMWVVTLSNSNLGVFLENDDFVSNPSNFSITKVSVVMCQNKSSGFTATKDGSVLFVIDQHDYPESRGSFMSSSADLSSIPTLKFPTGNVLAFLLCSPHVSIQTRQVRATGNGNLALENLKLERSQGNIDFYQANYLLSSTLLELPNNSGPTSFSGQVGTDLMARLLFGNGNVLDDQLKPAPLANITAVYKQVIHSAMKTFLSGAIATVNVSGGYAEEQMVFTSSLGHVITSAIFFAFLIIALVAAQFRKERVAFTFANVAAALADSDVPQKCVEMTQFETGTRERKVLKLVPSGNGQLNCAYQSIDDD